MICSLITNELLVFCRIKEMSSTRETSRAVPNGPKRPNWSPGKPGAYGATKNRCDNSVDNAATATTATTATWERGMQQVLARFWARRSGRGWISPIPNLAQLLSLLFCFTQVAATPLVVSLRFQTGTRSTDTVDANASVGNVRLESEVLVLALWGLD